MSCDADVWETLLRKTRRTRNRSCEKLGTGWFPRFRRYLLSLWAERQKMVNFRFKGQRLKQNNVPTILDLIPIFFWKGFRKFKQKSWKFLTKILEFRSFLLQSCDNLIPENARSGLAPTLNQFSLLKQMTFFWIFIKNCQNLSGISKKSRIIKSRNNANIKNKILWW